ncbi:hypothetical protein [Minwuia thermotolerans]|uniref:Pre ATP-grasp domain-containing protein n=1 Tax=Minwuia thermotolerans TaxID=2056226 RepID=A0A2M9FWV4_9PROT|nr:hypothetical protein [Minwuia thermotolerans]PJK27945.1 hypothetical protein CVT23_19620 [Minwuia thermotolerans]
MARAVLANEPSLGRTDFFGPRVSSGLKPGPALLIGDQREVGLFAGMREQRLEHRIALLADEGDFLVVEKACPRHEAFVRHLLGIHDLRIIEIGPPERGGPAAIASRCRSPALAARFADAARDRGCFQIVPYLGSGKDWALAGTIADVARVPVRVAAPPPQLAKRVNDKIWFADRVRAVLGPQALPPTFAAYGPAALAAHIRRLARNCEQVIVKTPDSAGSLGNVNLDAALIRGFSTERLHCCVLDILRARGWRDRYPLLVGVWETAALSSPSAQIWIPAPGDGDPVVEGIFEQRLAGDEAEFIGAAPAVLSVGVLRRICREAMALAVHLQALGYFGRCSFDCLITGEAGRARGVHWIECNGRWGGVSIPMSFVNRFFGRHAGRGMVIVQDQSLQLRVRTAEALYDLLGPFLLRRGKNEGIVPLAVGGIERSAGFPFLAVADSQARAETLAGQARALLARRG